MYCTEGLGTRLSYPSGPTAYKHTGVFVLLPRKHALHAFWMIIGDNVHSN